VSNVFKINYKRHPGQAEVIKGILSAQKALIFAIVCARGWGKTLFATNDIVIPRMLDIKNCQVMWVAPTYKAAKAPIEDVWFGIDENTGEQFIPQYSEKGFQFFEWKKADMEMHLFNGSKIFIRSASNPESIVSKGFNVIVIDEGALILKDVFMKQILPTARRKGVQIFIITTPRGRNWVYEMYLAGQDLSKEKYLSFQQPWWKRPDYPVILRELMKDMPEHLRKQEFEAQFIGDGGNVFKNLPAVFVGKEIQFPSQDQEWTGSCDKEMEDDTFVVSIDFAKSIDFTVITVMAMRAKRIVYYSRFNKTSYKVVLDRIKRIAESYDADVIFDATGVGSGLSDFMEKIGRNNHPFKFTNDSKNELINRLIVACEYGEIEIPLITTMREEFELFTYELTRTGKLAYHAPDGKHDDTVISVAMANWYSEETVSRTEFGEVDDFLNVVESVNRPKTRLEELMEDDD